jgi:hypothetical protein
MLVILNLVGHCSIFYVVFKELQNLERQNNIQFRKKKYLDTQIKINATKYLDRQKHSELQLQLQLQH